MKTLNLPIELDFGYHTKEVKEPKRIYLLLHGYMLDGQFMLDVLNNYLPKDANIISPNGPYLVPYKKGKSFFPRYSWYFFDPVKKSFYINYDPAANLLKTMIDELNPDKLPITIIGYSQGGYIAPKIAELCEQVDTVIGMACVFRNERFIERDITYHQIHSKTDLVVGFKDSKEEFSKLTNSGKYIELENEGHKLNPTYFESLKNLL